ncbi:MAG TPA: serine/threonine-protein kinase [Myxococcaceae bacterium]|nr:serine/threonine-protein kinase [Myxococcaceae bacterium]
MRISPASWSAVSGLLDQALDLDVAARAAWLEQLATTQPDLATVLRRLLEAHSAGATLERPPALEQTEPTAPEHRELAPGDRIGPYVVLEVLGSGGMAEVWRARRDDGAFHREVALKLPRMISLRRDMAARFARERDILAGLEHPNIARFYDAGVAADGLPYLAMELVDGKPLNAWCDERHLLVQARLRLFAQVLAAVQFAHANLVIHRDLKPSNILVTDEGQVRLLDFGIAKLLADDDRTQTEITRWGGRILTPVYASPEQIQGEALTIASDVYSLGVLLFELLTGARPYRLKVESVAQLEQAIVSEDPLRPSAAVTEEAAAQRGTVPTRLARRLVGDLDTILLKALAKAPAQRYPTVAALAEDLERHLDGRPVQAQPASAWYRLQKFTRRHRWAVLGSATAATLLIAITAVAVGQARRARAQERVALAEAKKANAVRDYLVEILAAADPSNASDIPVRDRTVQQAVDLAAQRIGPALADEPEVKLAVVETLATVYHSLDRPEKSRELAQQALALSEKIYGTPHPHQARLLAGMAGVEMFAGRIDEAIPWLEQAEAMFARLGDTTSEEYAQTLKMRGNLERRGNNPNLERARELLERAATLFRERYPKDSGRLGSLFFLSQTLRALGQSDRAEAVANEAVGLVQADESSSAGFDRPNAYSVRASLREANGDLAGSEADYAVADPLYRKSAGPEHFLTLQNDGLRGWTLLELGQRDRAMQLIQDSTRAVARVRPGTNTHAFAEERLGLALVMVGRYAEALPVLEEARSLWLKRHDERQRTVATLGLATAKAAIGQAGEARALLDEALAVRKRQQAGVSLSPADAELWRGLVAVDGRDAEAARREITAALAASGGNSRDEMTRQVLGQAGLARLALAEGDSKAALEAADRAVTAASSPRLRQFPSMEALALESRGRALCGLGRQGEGEKSLGRAVSLLVGVTDPTSPDLARVRLEQADCLVELGRVAEARPLVALAKEALDGSRAGRQFTEPLRVVQAKLERGR